MALQQQIAQWTGSPKHSMSISQDTTKLSASSKRPVMMRLPSEAPSEKGPGDPPTESSWGHFRVFLAAVCSEGLLFGICLSFGVFQDYYTNKADLPHNNRSSWIGLLAAGVAFLGAPAVTYCCKTFDVPRHYYIYFGWVLCLAGLLSSAFCRNVKALIVTQGLLFGFGLLIIEMPTLIILDSWFVKRRGLAYGLLYGMTDIFGVAWGFLASALLNGQGLRTTFLVFTSICFVIPGVAMLFLREKPPTMMEVMCSQSSSLNDLSATGPFEPETPTPSPRRYYRRSTFYILMAANLLQSFAFYLPFIYLPSYTTALGHSSSTGAVILAVANIAQVFGEIIFGGLSDKARVPTLVFCSAAVSSLAAFLIWTFANSLAYLIPFALLFGAFGAGFMALWPRMGTMFGEKDASMIYSIMSFGRGIGSIASGPISTALVHRHTTSVGQPPASVMHNYRPVMLFVGACMAGSALLGLAAWILSHWKSKESVPATNKMTV